MAAATVSSSPRASMMVDRPTLSRYLQDTAARPAQSTAVADCADICGAIGVACKTISHQVTMSSIEQTHAERADTNDSGDRQKELDIIANNVMISALRHCGRIAAMVSEENRDLILCDASRGGARYAVVFDPLDGSSNIECSVSVGTIFGIYALPPDAEPTAADVLRPGRELLAAGYVLYSSSTILVMSLGKSEGVRAFTMDPTVGEFVEMPASPVRVPASPKRIISGNTGNAEIWNLPTSEFVRWTRRQKERYSLRYIGSMVADVHRTLLYGGIFMYPADFFNRNGKLRILYECFPMAFVLEAAGGMASTGSGRILDITPTSLHQRSPIYIGCKRDVLKIEQLFKRVPHLYSMHCAPISDGRRTARHAAAPIVQSTTVANTTASSPPTTVPATTATATATATGDREVPAAKRPKTDDVDAGGAYWEFEMIHYTLTEDFAGDTDNFELSGSKGALFQELVRMNDPEWTLATDCDTGERGLLPTRLLVCSRTEVSHKVASTDFTGDVCSSDDAVEFLAGDAALKFRYMSDERWAFAVNARTGQSGIVPSAIFAS